MSDKRWKQRFQNFEKAFLCLENAVNTVNNDSNEIMQVGLIKTYEFTFELAWKTLKDYLEEQGFDVPSPRKTIKQAFQAGYIKDGSTWLYALDDRNKTTHIYNQVIAETVIEEIREKYFIIIKELYVWFKKEL